MGRSSTGVYSTSECRKLDLRWMLKNKQVINGEITFGTMSWSDESSASFECDCRTENKYFRVYYTITDRENVKTKLDYKIKIVTIPSNLGKGEVLYFVCPESYKRARVLYMAYRHHKYLHRDWYLEHYKLRLYYRTQQGSKDDYHSTRYFNIKNKVENLEKELFSKYRKSHYKGKATKNYKKLIDLKLKMKYHDDIRCKILCNRIGVKFIGF